ncbi:MAG: hypothetical protein ACYTGZ_13420 [Planctomycetota bacterium]|jgi:hypothetical protein
MRSPASQPRALFALAFTAMFLVACAARGPRHAVDTELAFAPLRTTVDSDLAARYLTGAGSDPEIAALQRKYDACDLRCEVLRALAEESSTDFAAAYFARRILAVPRHRDAQMRYADTLEALIASRPTRIDRLARDEYIFAFVPGLFYNSRPENGAAMAKTRAVLRARGFSTYLIPTGETSTVEGGARVLAAYLIEARKSGRKIILTSASKGGADVAHALGKLLSSEETSHVRGWVSIGGVLRGTPLADIGLTFPSSLLLGLTGWAHGTSLGVAKNLSTAAGARRFASYSFPSHLQVLHFVGVPLSGTVSESVRSNYNSMKPYGPNDGVTLLPDELLPQGHVILAIGADHRFQDSRIDLKTLALASMIIELIEEAERD